MKLILTGRRIEKRPAIISVHARVRARGRIHKKDSETLLLQSVINNHKTIRKI